MKNTFFISQICFAVLVAAGCKQDETSAELTDEASAVTHIQGELAFPGHKGTVKNAYLEGQLVSYSEINGLNILEGDILIRDSVLKSSSSPSVNSTGIKGQQYRWVEGRVYYKIDPDLPDKYRVRNAIAEWENKTPMRFIERTTQNNFIYFTPGSGCSSYIGKQGGRQEIYLSGQCNTGNAIHEIGHAVGLFHEHTRSDQSDFVNIKYDNVEDGEKHNFRTWKALGYDGFDRGASMNFSSIMMYGSYFFSKNGRPTITKKDGSTFDAQREKLSDRDVNTVKFMYNFN